MGIPHEQVVRVRRLAANAEELHKVVKLSVHVAANGDGAANILNVGLLHENLASLVNAKGRSKAH